MSGRREAVREFGVAGHLEEKSGGPDQTEQKEQEPGRERGHSIGRAEGEQGGGGEFGEHQGADEPGDTHGMLGLEISEAGPVGFLEERVMDELDSPDQAGEQQRGGQIRGEQGARHGDHLAEDASASTASAASRPESIAPWMEGEVRWSPH